MSKQQLVETASAMVSRGKGILAADESEKTLQSRFDGIGLEATQDLRRAYRDLLFTTPGLEDFISGVILYDETLRTRSLDDVQFPDLIAQQGIIPGAKVDTGLTGLAGFPGEQITEGLDGLRERVQTYRELGARFAKWRAVFAIGQGAPTRTCIQANAQVLARYAAICQEAGVVPIVEPEILMNGTHSIEECEEATETTLSTVFYELLAHRILLEGIVVKPSMVLSGTECPVQAGVEEVAEATIRCFRRTIPASVPGIAFLSGGQSPELSTAHLNAMNLMGPQPWEISFSYGRALQDPARAVWKGEEANRKLAQEVFYHRTKCNGAARFGKFSPEME
ncbi:MAG TPA: fructose-bisphosphate aldolase class I [Candidatus Latescibacteria bacterium]|nr:fructose-bisphosphate aldolase class I [Gemmatimonadota bacterium]HCR19277.1 fructose-bisphosphate aldolase class I [Candidatus Latescibacterota bacterium]|tara:strand:- start:3317 stop:4327 length:1011 start_codon:yes stop_codon:yes gene_type:complete